YSDRLTRRGKGRHRSGVASVEVLQVDHVRNHLDVIRIQIQGLGVALGRMRINQKKGRHPQEPTAPASAISHFGENVIPGASNGNASRQPSRDSRVEVRVKVRRLNDVRPISTKLGAERGETHEGVAA